MKVAAKPSPWSGLMRQPKLPSRSGLPRSQTPSRERAAARSAIVYAPPVTNLTPPPTRRPSLATRMRATSTEREAATAHLTPTQRADWEAFERADAAARAAWREYHRGAGAAIFTRHGGLPPEGSADRAELDRLGLALAQADLARDIARDQFTYGRERRERLARRMAIELHGVNDHWTARVAEATAMHLEGFVDEADRMRDKIFTDRRAAGVTPVAGPIWED